MKKSLTKGIVAIFVSSSWKMPIPRKVSGLADEDICSKSISQKVVKGQVTRGGCYLGLEKRRRGSQLSHQVAFVEVNDYRKAKIRPYRS